MFQKINRNAPCWCGSGKKYKQCHEAFDSRMQSYARLGHRIPPRNIIKTPEQIAGIRESAKRNIAILDYVAEHICVGMSTEEIDRLVAEKTRELGAIAAPLGYQGFPKSVCTSINEQVCHGIPAETDILKDGDIVNVDVSTIYNGYFSDSSRMFCLGNVSPEKQRLVEVTKECIQVGLEHAKPWTLLGDLGYAINEHARKNGYTVVREIGGHGVGLEFHEEPWVGYTTPKNSGMLLVPGMVFTIEPMVNMGCQEIYVDDDNGWTVYTDDGEPSAQWEVQVLITEDGHEILAY